MHNVMPTYSQYRMAIIIIQKVKLKGVGKDVDKLESLYTSSRNVKWYSTVENSLVVPQKVKHRITIWVSNSTLRYVLPNAKKKKKNWKEVLKFLYKKLHSSTIPNSPTVETTRISINGLMDSQMWYIHTMVYNSVMKKNEVTIYYAVMWMSLKNIMLSERSQTQMVI